MKAPTTVRGWCLTVAGGVATTVIVFGLVALRSHFVTAEETDDRALENEQRNVEQDAAIAPIKALVEKLGQRHADSDAAEAERAKLCRMGIITDKRMCGEVGEEVVE